MRYARRPTPVLCALYLCMCSSAYLVEQEGLARFCSQLYSPPRPSNMDSSCMHLTNSAVNKNAPCERGRWKKHVIDSAR